MYSVLTSLGCDEELVKKNYRTMQVKEMWSEVVEEIFLDHTNAVFILNENNKKVLIVYVDESIFAAELNGRRELIKLKFLQQFNEELDEFKICISRGAYKKNYPFRETDLPSYVEQVQPITLSEDELNNLHAQTKEVKNPKIRNTLLKAMIADLEWKKGLDEKKPKNVDS